MLTLGNYSAISFSFSLVLSLRLRLPLSPPADQEDGKDFSFSNFLVMYIHPMGVRRKGMTRFFFIFLLFSQLPPHVTFLYSAGNEP